MKSQVLHTVWCIISGEAAGEIWRWSLLGVKRLIAFLFIWLVIQFRLHDTTSANQNTKENDGKSFEHRPNESTKSYAEDVRPQCDERNRWGNKKKKQETNERSRRGKERKQNKKRETRTEPVQALPRSFLKGNGCGSPAFKLVRGTGPVWAQDMTLALFCKLECRNL